MYAPSPSAASSQVPTALCSRCAMNSKKPMSPTKQIRKEMVQRSWVPKKPYNFLSSQAASSASYTEWSNILVRMLSTSYSCSTWLWLCQSFSSKHWSVLLLMLWIRKLWLSSRWRSILRRLMWRWGFRWWIWCRLGFRCSWSGCIFGLIIGYWITWLLLLLACMLFRCFSWETSK